MEKSGKKEEMHAWRPNCGEKKEKKKKQETDLALKFAEKKAELGT